MMNSQYTYLLDVMHKVFTWPLLGLPSIQKVISITILFCTQELLVTEKHRQAEIH